MTTTTPLPKMVGASVRRVEDPRLVTGQGKYTDDVDLRGMLYMAVLRSPHAHARILRLDAAGARAHSDVRAVLTGDEVRQRCGPLPVVFTRSGIKTTTRWPIVTDIVRYVGEPVAAVVAASRAAARDAADLIEVEYERLPPVVDVEAAAEAGSSLVHEDLGTNLCVDSSKSVGDPERAFREADGVVSARFEEPRIVLNPMEARAVVASYDRGTRHLTIWDTTQEPHKDRGEIAEVLGIPESRIRVIAQDVGGGFGCKISAYPEVHLAAMFAMDLGAPVKWVEEREEHFISTTQGRGEVQYAEAAYRRDGTLLALRIRYYTDLGAYSHGTAHTVVDTLTPSGAVGPYRVRDLEWTTYGVYTNKVPVGPYRGYGRHATALIGERVMDLIARELNMDPAEVRRLNFLSPDQFPYRSPTGLEYDSGDYAAALDKVLELVDYPRLREEQRELRRRGKLMGIGIATHVDVSGYGPTGALSSRPGYESALVRMDSGANVTVITGSSPHGQAHETTFAQIAADELEVPFEDVEVLHSDTDLIGIGQGTWGSRSVVVGGTAIVHATARLKDKARQVAAALLRTEPQYVVLEDGRFFVEDIPDRYITWPDVAREAYQARNLPRDVERGLEATAYWEPSEHTYPYSANVAVVIVDQETGEVTLTRYAGVDDCGTIINPMVVDGQVHGSLAQGIGAALLEQALWGPDGQLLSGSFMDYAMPLAEDLPMFELDRTVTPSPRNPLGTKGGGEMGATVAPPAVVNAVVDALAHLGVDHVDIPVTAERVWRALRGQGSAG